LIPDDRELVFAGSMTTTFSFVAIPSIFESEIKGDPSEGKGYHLALGSKNNKGSQSKVDGLSSAGFLNVELQFEQGIAALYTKREYKVRWLTVIMAILGSISGLAGIIAYVMSFIEEKWITYRAQKKKDELDEEIIPKRYLLEYLEDK